MLDLFLGRIAFANHGLFNLSGGIFVNFQVPRNARTNGSAARLPQFQGRRNVYLHEHLLNDHIFRRIARNNFTDAIKYFPQPFWKRLAGDTDAATGDIMRFGACHFNHAEARYKRARINAEDSGHARAPKFARYLSPTCLFSLRRF